MDSVGNIYREMLVVRCQVGDRAAMEELVALCHPRLRGFLYKMVKDHTSLDDLVQDVWMEVFHDLPRLTSPAAFLPWFYKIARHRAFRAIRKRGIPTQTVDIDAVDAPDESSATKEFSNEDVELVNLAMEQLSPEMREVLLLRFMEDMSYEEIAQVVSCPVGTVRSRIHNAKQALSRIIERQANYVRR